ncbi:uncharacterized protein LOC120551266 [Perca fluviatilis]|uniref:uncharacterized protein LOC120551266 n=1 Tax=Perca fluviatilis TaxID=8168 RepID=UPI0019663451|nr:uncharacterized protein LOC120551266 [Perca fluviatilis]
MDQLSPAHKAMFPAVLTLRCGQGRCQTWRVSGSGSPECCPPRPGGRRAAGAARRVVLWEEVLPGRRDDASGFHQGHEERGVEVLPLIVVLQVVLMHLPPLLKHGVALCVVTQEANYSFVHPTPCGQHGRKPGPTSLAQLLQNDIVPRQPPTHGTTLSTPGSLEARSVGNHLCHHGVPTARTLGEVCVASGPSALITTRTLQGAPPHSDGVPEENTAAIKGLRSGDAAANEAGWLRGVKPHPVRVQDAPPSNDALDVLVHLDGRKEASLAVLLQPGDVCRWDAMGLFPQPPAPSLPAPPARHNI